MALFREKSDSVDAKKKSNKNKRLIKIPPNNVLILLIQ